MVSEREREREILPWRERGSRWEGCCQSCPFGRRPF
jgi:hypothetical protein